MSDVLFLYATREGQTRLICEHMAEAMRTQGMRCTLLDLEHPSAAESLKTTRQVVLGASIRYGHLPDSLYAFISNNRQALDSLPSTFFCVNLTARKPGKDTPEGSVYMRTFLKKTTWRAQNLAVFAGALRYSRYTWYDRMMIRFIMLITGGPTDPNQDVEFTDWERVRNFALKLAGTNAEQTPRQA